MRRKRRAGPPEKYVAQGRGQGVGPNYIPWLTVRDVPSTGLSTRSKDRRSGRVRHTLSTGETRLLRLADWGDRVLDAREQFPLLPLRETVAIAATLGVRPPAVRREPIVMTTDVLFTLKIENGRAEKLAVAFKLSSDLRKPRVLEKLAIESVYWSRRNVRWIVLSETELPNELCINLRRLDAWHDPRSFRPDDPHRAVRLAELHQYLLAHSHVPLAQSCRDFDTVMRWPRGESLAAVHFALAHHLWRVDLRAPIDTLAVPCFLTPE
jgi:hypothetical protein